MLRGTLLTVREIQKIDKFAIEKVGIPSLVLMENAGRAVANEVLNKIKSRFPSCVTVICGCGNNAGDGFVVARHLLIAGIRVSLFLIAQPDSLKADALVNYRILNKLKFPIQQTGKSFSAFCQRVSRSLVVDAIFGTGLNRQIQEPYTKIIDVVNKRAKDVVAVDIPSGLNGTTGEVYGIAVKANSTVTFVAAKKGFFRKEGPSYVGKIIVADIGIPQKGFSKK